MSHTDIMRYKDNIQKYIKDLLEIFSYHLPIYLLTGMGSYLLGSRGIPAGFTDILSNPGFRA